MTRAAASPLVSIRTNPKPDEQRGMVRARMPVMAREIADGMAPLVREGQVKVTETARGVIVEINASVLFSPGDARPDATAAKALQAVAEILAHVE